ncbi:MAG: S-adenosylmethionine:tRNA ribosyltransferase-isomerase, partial [Oscillospiraceae bacterium]|nr:S-adenosylmethionine:tRNA ribosyltransferase-isomerase [Oscillospiraceae bacterium]
MNKSDFNFDLPPELIAQTPIERREQSRLLCLGRYTGEISHRRFYELPKLLSNGDCLVLNDSRVLPARLVGKRETGGAVEVVLLRDLGQSPEDARSGALNAGGGQERAGSFDEECEWECLVRPGKKVRVGTRLLFGNGELTAIVTGETDSGNRHIKFIYHGVFHELLERLG